MSAAGKMTAIFQTQIPLSKKDFIYFHSLFSQEINHLLPFSGSVHFWESSFQWFSKEKCKELLGNNHDKLSQISSSLQPAIVNNILIVPVTVEGKDNIAVLVDGVDPPLLRKMAPEWLVEFRVNLQHSLSRIKEAYIYTETGLYTGRLFDLLWNDSVENEAVFFLLAMPERTKSATGELMKIRQNGHLLGAVVNGPVFYFGGQVFGVYQENMSRNDALGFAHRLLGRLKRQGKRSVHIGISLLDPDSGTKDKVLEECWQALEIAEKRGPFSLCEASYIIDRQNHPFAGEPSKVTRKLQNAWRGLEAFSLLLMRTDDNLNKQKRKRKTLAQIMFDNFQDYYNVIPVDETKCYVVLPDVPPEKAERIASRIKKKVDAVLQPQSLAVGISYWPCENYNKTATIVNCRKALMHGDFFGPGSVTLFDHLSLNVSGDYFFDEGDYRCAVKDYRDGLKMDPGDVNLSNSLGVALTELNKLPEALKCFDRVLKQEPANFMALVNKGFALRMLKKNDEALACLARAGKCREFSSSKAFGDIALLLGRLYCENGQYAKAVDILEKMRSRKTEKSGYLIFSFLGEAYAATGRNKKGIAMLQKAIQINPHDARSMSILGELYGIEGEGDDIALSLCSQAVTLNDSAWENWYRLAKVRFKTGDFDDALVAVREALSRDRKAVEAIFLAGMIQKKCGELKKAAKLFHKVLRIAPDFPGALTALKELH